MKKLTKAEMINNIPNSSIAYLVAQLEKVDYDTIPLIQSPGFSYEGSGVVKGQKLNSDKFFAYLTLVDYASDRELMDSSELINFILKAEFNEEDVPAVAFIDEEDTINPQEYILSGFDVVNGIPVITIVEN